MAQTNEPDPPKRYSSLPANQTPLVILALVVLGVAAAYWLLARPQRPDPAKHPGVGKRLEFLELLPLTGDAQPLGIDGLAGRVTLLNFWGTWCPPCRQELPHMAALVKRFEGHKDFQLPAVSYPAGGQNNDVESLREQTAATLKSLGIDMPAYHDPQRTTLSELDRVFGFGGFPTSVLLDRHGVIRAVWVGYWPGMETEVERHVGMLLEEEEKPTQRLPAEE